MFPPLQNFPWSHQAEWDTPSSVVTWHFVLSTLYLSWFCWLSVSSTSLWAPRGQAMACFSVSPPRAYTVPGPRGCSGNVWWMKVIWCRALCPCSRALMPQPCSTLPPITWCCYPPNHEKPPHRLPHRTSCFLRSPCPSLCSPEACGAVWVLSH